MVFFLVRRSAEWLKHAWIREPIIFTSCAMGITGPLIVLFSPFTKDSIATMKSIPRHYPYPQLQNSNGNGNVDNEGETIYPYSP